jgi:intraflagellar transport protein 80
MSVFGQDLNTAEVAYASIDEIQKVQFICNAKLVPSQQGQAAELALLRKQPKEAESILLGANLIYKAIRMWIDLFNWDRALELAIKYKTHIDTVLFYRSKYLRALEIQETNKTFIKCAEEVSIYTLNFRFKLMQMMLKKRLSSN